MYRIDPRSNFEPPVELPDIGLRIDAGSVDLEGHSEPVRRIRVEDGGSTIVYSSERNATFEVIGGREIVVDPASLENEEEIALNLLGPLLRLVLLQRGEFVLHASVVRVGTRTAIFIAPSGRGKSTMAADLYDRGHDVLSDDVGIVRPASEPDVLAGPPVLKLHEESAARIDRRAEPVFSDGLESGKRFYRLTDDGVPDRTPLDAVYLLERGDAIELEPVSARDATVAFLENSWGLPDVDDGAVAETLRRCSQLAETATVTRVRYPRSFEAFDDVLLRIEEDCTDGH